VTRQQGQSKGAVKGLAKMSRENEVSLLQAFDHPLRVRIWREVKAARSSGISPGEMSERLDEKLANVSYHVRVLNQAGALECIKAVPVRGALRHIYVVNSEVAKLEWVEAVTKESLQRTDPRSLD
jgi:DNA-binding transcriptional ArsR family regulator